MGSINWNSQSEDVTFSHLPHNCFYALCKSPQANIFRYMVSTISVTPQWLHWRWSNICLPTLRVYEKKQMASEPSFPPSTTTRHQPFFWLSLHCSATNTLWMHLALVRSPQRLYPVLEAPVQVHAIPEILRENDIDTTPRFQFSKLGGCRIWNPNGVTTKESWYNLLFECIPINHLSFRNQRSLLSIRYIHCWVFF